MPLPDVANRVEKAPLRDRIYRLLHEWIIAGTLRPGEHIRDGEVAEHLGVSRTPVREAFQQLAYEGLIETTANRWTRVAPLDVSLADRIYPIVSALESLAVSLAAHRYGRVEREAMTDANARLADALEQGDAAGALDADADFHGAFSVASENPDLRRLLSGLRSQLRRLELAYLDAGLGQKSVREHAAVIEALDARDSERAVKAIEEHWRLSSLRFSALATEIRPGSGPEPPATAASKR